MKWPNYVMLIRHDKSVYNILKEQKERNPTYQKFLWAYDKNWRSWRTRRLARKAWEKFALNVSDARTPLLEGAGQDAMAVGTALQNIIEPPDVIIVSPYKRTLCTLANLARGWPKLKSVKTYEDEYVREQEHGLLTLYNDKRLFFVFHPEQREYYEQEGPYAYRYPQGENVPDVRKRARLMIGTIIREFSEKNVLIVSHHLNILAMIAGLRRLSAREFMLLDKEEKPINCGVTLFRGDPGKGRDGRLEMEFYNSKFY